MSERALDLATFVAPIHSPDASPPTVSTRRKALPDPIVEPSQGVIAARQGPAIGTAELGLCIEEWLLDCELRQHAATTNATRRVFTHNLMWFLKHRGFEKCGTRELKQFFFYLARGHEEPGGRWGQARFTKPMRPVSIKDYHTCLRSLFAWMVDEEILASSPMARVERPRVCEEVKQPLSPQQVEMLLRAARLSENPKRDEAIVMLLLDSGVRASELVQLKVKDIDLKNAKFVVLGKGNKLRSCYFGKKTCAVLLRYLRAAKLDSDSPLFLGTRGTGSRQALTRSGLLQLLQRLGRVVGVEVNVHQMRRTFATTILENGSNLVAVRDMLGHSTITMTLKYLSISQSHIESQHRENSPGDHLHRKR